MRPRMVERALVPAGSRVVAGHIGAAIPREPRFQTPGTGYATGHSGAGQASIVTFSRGRSATIVAAPARSAIRPVEPQENRLLVHRSGLSPNPVGPCRS